VLLNFIWRFPRRRWKCEMLTHARNNGQIRIRKEHLYGSCTL